MKLKVRVYKRKEIGEWTALFLFFTDAYSADIVKDNFFKINKPFNVKVGEGRRN